MEKFTAEECQVSVCRFPGKQVTEEKYDFWCEKLLWNLQFLMIHEPHLLGKPAFAVTWSHKENQSKSYREEAQSSTEKQLWYLLV